MRPNLQPMIGPVIAAQRGIFTVADIVNQVPGEGETWNRHSMTVAVRRQLGVLAGEGVAKVLYKHQGRGEVLYGLSGANITPEALSVAVRATVGKREAGRKRAFGWVGHGRKRVKA